MRIIHRKAKFSLTAAAVAVTLLIALLWWHSFGSWQTVSVRAGSAVWSIDSTVGNLTVSCYRYANAARFHYRRVDSDPHLGVTPIFATTGDAASGNGVDYGIFALERGRVRLPLDANGAVDLDWKGLAQSGATRFSPSVSVWSVSAPLWFLTLLPALVAASLLGQAAYKLALRNRRRSSGLCENCGYDLHASPGTCPECGRVGESAVNHAR